MTEIEKIKKILKKYSVKEAYIFGSYKDNPKEARDIDIAISLGNYNEFFKISAALAMSTKKPLDLIWLDQASKFKAMVKKQGLKIYG